jgi:hypothetical protein
MENMRDIINKIEEINVEDTGTITEAELKVFQVSFSDKFEAGSEEEVYSQILEFCQEVVDTGDVTAFNVAPEVEGRPGNFRIS